MKINIFDIETKNKSIIEAETRKFFERLPINPDLVINIGAVAKTKIRTLNKQYRHLDKPTDVLSFPIWGKLADLPGSGQVLLGDIIICPEIIQDNAKKQKTLFRQELKRVIEHSLNHLIGKHH